MISLYLYLMLLKFCNNCIGKGVAHQVYPPHPHPWAIPSPTHFFWQAACRHSMWKSEKMSIHDFEKKTSWAKCIGILNKVSQLDTNSALRRSVVFLWCSFGIFAGYIGLRVNRTNPVCYRCLEMEKAVYMRSRDAYYLCVCVLRVCKM